MRFMPGLLIVVAASPLIFISSHETRAQFIQKKALPSAPEPKRRPWPVANIEIANEPKTIDPTTQLPPDLAKLVTVKFDNTPLMDVVAWLKEEFERGVVLEEETLKAEGIELNLPISEDLRNEPVYMLLDRLSELGIGWHLKEEILHVTSVAKVRDIETVKPYYVGDLLDNGFLIGGLIESIFTIPNSGFGADRNLGKLSRLGDVLVVQTSHEIHREIGGLLAALRKPGRRTFVRDAHQHQEFRKQLDKIIDVDFQNTVLSQAIQEVARLAGMPMTIDHEALKTEGISESDLHFRLQLRKQKVRSILYALFEPVGMAWDLQHGQMLATTAAKMRGNLKTAVFDIRDICRDLDEAHALASILELQRFSHDFGQEVQIHFPHPGIMVARHSEQGLDRLLDFLENYRTALPPGKPRRYLGDDPEEVFTLFYHVPTAMAKDLLVLIPEMIHPESWKQANRPDAPGTLRIVAFEPRFITPQSTNVTQQAAEKEKPHALVDYSILCIIQTRKNHDRIGTLLERMKRGDTHINATQRQRIQTGPVGLFDRD